jgi:plastocyanin
VLNLRADAFSTRQQKGGGELRTPRFFAAVLLTGYLCLGGVMPAAAGETAEVVMEKMEFVPPKLKIKPGTTVTWVNREKRTNHSVLFEQENMLESDRLFPGETYQRTFDKPGTYPYRCGPHPEMVGVIEVAE